MAKDNLSAEFVRDLLDYDAASGVFVWRKDAGRKRAGEPAGRTNSRGYVDIDINRQTYRAHRLVWLVTYGVWPVGEVDHINRNRADNRLCNLRDVPRHINRQNEAGPHAQNKLGVRGVKASPTRGKYLAKIKANGKDMHLGTFDSIEAAQTAYENARRKFHPGCPAQQFGADAQSS